MGSDGFQHVVGCQRAVIDVQAHIEPARRDIGVRAQVPHQVVACHRPSQAVHVQHVSLDETHAVLVNMVLDPVLMAGGEVIVDGNLVSLNHQTFYQVAADEAGASGYEVPDGL